MPKLARRGRLMHLEVQWSNIDKNASGGSGRREENQVEPERVKRVQQGTVR